MTKRILLFGVILSLMMACSPAAEEEKKDVEDSTTLSGNEKKFFDNLSSLCGNKYEGEEIFTAEGRESFADKNMTIHFASCTDDKIRIPFYIGDDESRTWLLLVEDGQLRFRHDHRHEDGTPEDITMYGGFSDQRGTEFTQFFPPDDYTLDLLERAPGHEWVLSLTEEMDTLCYCLQSEEELVFKAKFYLDKKLN